MVGNGLNLEWTHCFCQFCAKCNGIMSVFSRNHSVPFQCSMTCGFGHIERDVVCMKKLGRAMAVVGEENCLKEEKPDTRRECQEKPCRPQWYMADWSEVSQFCHLSSYPF